MSTIDRLRAWCNVTGCHLHGVKPHGHAGGSPMPTPPYPTGGRAMTRLLATVLVWLALVAGRHAPRPPAARPSLKGW